MPIQSSKDIPKLHKCIAILWPSFLTAGIATGLFFSAFHPNDLFPFDIDHQVSPLGVYSVGFFLFWALTALSGIGTLYFAITNCLHCSSNNDQSSDQS